MNQNLQDLKNEAKVLGISFSPNIGEDALREKIALHMSTPPDKEFTGEAFAENYAEAMKLVRVEITPNRADDAGLKGDEFAVQSKYLGFVYRWVRFGKPTHIPNVLIESIKERVYTKKIEDGGVNEQPMVAELRRYTVNYLDPLTEEEVEKINFMNKQAGR